MALAHRRLSIIDLSDAGRQPMASADGTLLVAFNGEIYNFRELRAELTALGCVFRTRTDTEILLHGYREWGMARLLQRLRGMFAFALWDEGSGGQLHLARDRFGIKPLYFSELKDGRVAFASEVKALTRSGLVDDAEDPQAWLGFLLFGYVPGNITTAKAVRSLPAGHHLCASRGEIVMQCYYESLPLFGRELTGNPNTPLRSLLERSTELHLISDAPLGVFLSGGLDSTALTGLASLKKPGLKSLSIVFDDTGLSEGKFQRLAAARFGTEHHEELVKGADFEECLGDFFGAMDQPTVDGLNTFVVARAARRAGLKAVLSGIGADEIFRGYAIHNRAVWLRAAQRVGHLIPWGALHRLRPGADRLALLARPGLVPLYLVQRGLFPPLEAARILGLPESRAWDLLNDLEPRGGAKDAASALRSMDFEFYLRNQLLRDADVFGMSHGVEIRVPFLDHKLTEAALAGGSPRAPAKAEFIDAVRDIVPTEILSRPKVGFELPLRKWLGMKAGEHWARPWALRVLRERRA